DQFAHAPVNKISSIMQTRRGVGSSFLSASASEGQNQFSFVLVLEKLLVGAEVFLETSLEPGLETLSYNPETFLTLHKTPGSDLSKKEEEKEEEEEEEEEEKEEEEEDEEQEEEDEQEEDEEQEEENEQEEEEEQQKEEKDPGEEKEEQKEEELMWKIVTKKLAS
ncbi:hypothetical protein STEG23_007922, partial [Scotinomys teguina]